MKDFEKNWTTTNNGYELNSDEVQRLINVLPNENQKRLANKPFYAFIHFGMNTSTQREWGCGNESCDDFKIKSVNTKQWVNAIKASGATGIIFTCKHHDGFCLWDTKYTDFNVMNTTLGKDVVALLSNECARQEMDFGVYLSPWDMHEKTYATPAYNDYFCNQLTELLTNYGDIFEVWFDGAKGSNAKEFEYDWQRYYDLIHNLQPKANIAICGPDIRWVGNEGGKTRKSEYSVVPASLQDVEKIMKNSQKAEKDAYKLQAYKSTDEDLGSRKALKKCNALAWYPAEVDVSIRKGWFYSKDENKTVKSSKKLFDLYLNSVGKNCTFLLNVPPTDKGVIHIKDVNRLKRLGKRIKKITDNPILVQELGELDENNGFIQFSFDGIKNISYIIIKEDISYSQRVEAFDIYVENKNGRYKKAFKGTVIGSKRIIPLNKIKAKGVCLVIRQSRSNPVIKEFSVY